MSSDTEPVDGAVDPEDTAPPVEMRYGAPVTDSLGQVVLHPDRESYLSVVEAIRADGYWVCVDLCGVDYLGRSESTRGLPPGVTAERFEVVAQFLNHTERARIRLRVQVPESDPTVPTIFGLHPGVENHERETWDLFGITFDGHPDHTRILMPDQWEGHPLRRDYDVGRIPVQFKGAPSAR